MQSYINELKEKGLVPLRLDRNTVILVPPEKANEKYKARYLKMPRGRGGWQRI